MFGILTNIFTNQVGQSSGRGLSTRLWSLVHNTESTPDGSPAAAGLSDDLMNVGGSVGGTTAATAILSSESGGFGVYTSANTAIAPLATENGGVIRFSTPAATNSEAYLTTGGNIGSLGKIDDTPGNGRLTVFEARLRVGQAVNQGAFLGLADPALAAAGTLVNTTGVPKSTVDCIGFSLVGATLKFIYQAAGQTAQAAQINGSPWSATLTPATWYKVGLVYDPTQQPSQRLRVYLNGADQSCPVPDSAMYASGAAIATWPNAVPLAALVGFKSAEAVTKTLDLDWLAFWQQQLS
jgi:hypothetical protein